MVLLVFGSVARALPLAGVSLFVFVVLRKSDVLEGRLVHAVAGFWLRCACTASSWSLLLCARLSFCGSRTSWKVVSRTVLLVFGSVARALPLAGVSLFVLVFRFAEVGRLGRSSRAWCCWFLAPLRVHCL